MGELPGLLLPVTVEKPWGREVWYSGVEARGESLVRTGEGDMPLSEFLHACGRTLPVILLKSLQPTKGSLYLEVHETKSEVYIIDRIDATSGRMLLGACPAKRAELGDAALRDALLDTASRAEAGAVGIDAVQAFMRAVDLHPGDAVTIPPRVPHSLLQGVHVIEFQTPVFERKILAASQPVVTQGGWDSEDAVSAMDLSAQGTLTSPAESTSEVIARPPGFTVTRHRLSAGETFTVPAWAVTWMADGRVECGGVSFTDRTAFVAPTAILLQAVGSAEVLVGAEA